MSDKQNFKPFLVELAKYFMEFLETDFHKRRIPKRNIKYRDNNNFLLGLNLNKYQKLDLDFRKLLLKGIPDNEKLTVKAGSPKSVYDFIQDAFEAGVKFFCCSPNLDLFDMSQDDLIPECSGIVGGAHLIEAVMEEDCRVLTY